MRCSVLLGGAAVFLVALWASSSREDARAPARRDEGGGRVEVAPSPPRLAAVEAAAPRATPGAAARIVISELNYHPASDDPADEWVELFHAGGSAADLSGWQLAGDVAFTFPGGTRVGPGTYLVVAADARRFRESRGENGSSGAPVLGDWSGRLGRRRGEVRLLDREKAEVDALAYEDRAPFPELADGFGHSLERRTAAGPSNDPANWGASTGAAPASATAAGWRRLRVTGTATSNLLYIYLAGAGTVLVDDVSVRESPAAANLIEGGDFEGSRTAWRFTGNHGRSRITNASPRSGASCLRLAATGPGGSSRASAMNSELRVVLGKEYVLELWVRFEGAATGLTARLSGARPGSGIYLEFTPTGSTPGGENSLSARTLPPFVYPVSHHPALPRAGEAVTIRARVSGGSALRSVVLHYDAGRGETSVPLTAAPGRGSRGEDGARGEFSASIGPFPAAALVRYRIEVEGSDGSTGRFPLSGSPTPLEGFRVAEPGAASKLPVYHLYLSDAALTALNSAPSSDTYQPGTLVYGGQAHAGVGVRRRGHTSRYYPKHHWKIRFNNDHGYRSPTSAFRRVRSINLNSAYADKIFLREPLGYALWRDLGEPYSQTSFVRMFLNDEFLGLYVQVENPGSDYLKRNRLEAGWLWKAYGSGHGEGRLSVGGSRGFLERLGFGRRRPASVDATRSTRFGGIHQFELKVGDAAVGAARLTEFLENINALQGKELEAYVREHMNVESVISYLAANQVIHNAEHLEKNYLIYADPDGRFTLLPWDLDLTHGRNFEMSGGIINDQLRWDMWDAEFSDEQLLFGTLVHPKCDGPWNALINAVLGKTAAFRPQYYERIAYCLRHYYHPDVLIPKVERWRDLIRADVAADRERWRAYYPGDTAFDRRLGLFIDWIRRRYLHLTQKLAALGYRVGPPLSASFEADAPRGTRPLEVRFRNHSVGEIASYSWDFGDGTQTSDREPRHVYEKPGRYDVSLTVAGAGGSHRTLRRECIWVARGEEEE